MHHYRFAQGKIVAIKNANSTKHDKENASKTVVIIVIPPHPQTPNNFVAQAMENQDVTNE